MVYIELFLKTTDAHRDDVVTTLYDHDCYIFEETGSEIIDELDRQKDAWDFVDESVLAVEPGSRTYRVYFEGHDRERALALQSALEEFGTCELTTTDDEDWANNWKKYYEPVEVGEDVVIVPSWLSYDGTHTTRVIIEPGMAFGTGTHETTFMCLEALERYVTKGDEVFDIGCGSGILGVAALKLGAEHVVAVDIDAACVVQTHENAELNEVADRMAIHQGDLFEVIDGEADLIVSNIIAEVIAGMVGDLKHHLKVGGIFITSGIIVEKLDLVTEALQAEGFELLDTKRLGGWAMVEARRV
ncbi:50S ribosomal protein L11 methyltransferase [Peptoniphilus equinus]|uniref:Ribosomal protein L11 methyltransferase n=1 Tax=Peptoniphilus equinus TaxID=3016343 RepID=A0ABY7QVD6_9FIRM|nr:50S ribosomal protein L11 methyltransferase [Peptoniphilus equinus]WBW50366.1 50S ribosomal protein L11 methyltransferase [Peptoniphilus equinus]